MGKPANVDEYIAKLEGTFAHPILSRMREIIHEAAPLVEEKIKWGAPSFEHKGIMIGLVAFKSHAAAWFHKGALLTDPEKLLQASSGDTKSMRKYQVKSLEELNERAFKALVTEAVQIQESGEQVKNFNERSSKYDKSDLLNEALLKNDKARATFDGLSNYKKREYIEHIEGAKQQATRERRLAKSLAMLEDGMGLHDKYRK